MASFDYAKLAASARQLLARFGGTFEMTRQVGDYNPVSGAYPDESASWTQFPTWEVTALKLPAKGVNLEMWSDHVRVGLTTGRFILFIAAADGLAQKPRSSDKLNVGGTIYHVEAVADLTPNAETSLIYYLAVSL